MARRKGLVINDEQLRLLDDVLAKLRRVSGSKFVAVISTSGQPITTSPADIESDTLSLAALTASSYAAARQLAEVLNEREFTILFHEGRESNLHVVQITDQVLLLIMFGRETQVGRVRLYTTRALEVLRPVFEPGDDSADEKSPLDSEYFRQAGAALDDLLPGRTED